jgi:hypothetical protein
MKVRGVAYTSGAGGFAASREVLVGNIASDI